MNVSYDVSVWDLVKRSDRRRGYRIRWTVARRTFERRFATKLLADSFRSELVKRRVPVKASTLLWACPSPSSRVPTL